MERGSVVSDSGVPSSSDEDLDVGRACRTSLGSSTSSLCFALSVQRESKTFLVKTDLFPWTLPI